MDDMIVGWTQAARRGARRMVEFIGAIWNESAYALRHPGKFRRRELVYYLDLCGGKSLPIVLLICFLMGMILALQAALQMRKFGTELFVADLVGFSLLKELVSLQFEIKSCLT